MGDVNITISDGQGGSLVVPLSSVCAMLGVSSAGTVNQPVVASGLGGPAVLRAALGDGPLVEASALVCLAGGTVIAQKCGTKNKGTASAVTAGAGNTGLTVMTVVLDGTQGAFDDYIVKVKGAVAGTIGTSASIQISLDAGRNWGPVIALGTATTYAIPHTGITLSFTSATIAVGDTYTFGTYAPSTATTDTGGGVKEALNALAASPYALTGWGCLVIVGGPDGTQCLQGWSATDAHTIHGYFETLATAGIFSRYMVQARDVSPASKWGGTGETEAAWQASLVSDFGSASDKRLLAGAGYYNIPSAFPNAAGGAWVPRRSGVWAAACRQVRIALKTLSSRGSDGPLSQISVNSTTDPTDGFVYHDERSAPGLTAARFMAFRTRLGQTGFWVDEPCLMAPFGSDFDLWPKGVVMDAACSIVAAKGVQYLNSDVRLNPTTLTIDERDARAAEIALKGHLDTGLTSTGQISAAAVRIDRTNNIQVTKKFIVTITIVARGYILSMDITIGYGSLAAAA